MTYTKEQLEVLANRCPSEVVDTRLILLAAEAERDALRADLERIVNAALHLERVAVLTLASGLQVKHRIKYNESPLTTSPHQPAQGEKQ